VDLCGERSFVSSLAITVLGRRSYRNTLALVRDVADRMEFEALPWIVTDGFDFYEKVVRRVLRAGSSLSSGPQDPQE